MARRSSTAPGGTPSNESDSAADRADDPGAGGGAHSSADAANAQGADAANAQGADVPPPAKRRKRGPNKPKPGTFVVETKARMKQEEIIKLLIAHAVTQLGGDVANSMTLQINVDGECRPLGDVLPQGATLQFGTFVKADG